MFFNLMRKSPTSTPRRQRKGRTARRSASRPGARHRAFERLECRTVLSGWLAQIGGLGEEFPSNEQVMDSAGNMYLNGRFQQTVDFDPSTAVTTLASAGGSDGFLAKYALNGTLLWARRFGGSAQDEVKSVAVDPSGQFVYATGAFQGSADFTGDGVPDAKADKFGYDDVFLVKLNAANGQTVWVKTVGSTKSDVGNDVATDGFSVYVTGSFSGPADFDPGPNTATLTPAGRGSSRPSDAFVWKLNDAGNYAAAWQIGGTFDQTPITDAGTSLALDGNGLYLQGTFGGTVDFDPGPGVQSRTSVGSVDQFTARYTTAGALTWVNSIGGINYDVDFRMTAGAGSLYLSGDFSGAIDFEPGNGTTVLDSGNASTDVAIAKYAKADGSLAWARQFGGLQNEFAGVNVLPTTGAVYFGMNSLSPTIDLNPGGAGGEFTNTSSEGFLVKLDDTNGNYLNAWQVYGPGYESAVRPMGLINGTLYVAGRFSLTANFPTGGTLTSNGGSDLYLMAFDDPPALPSTPSPLGAASAATVVLEGGSPALTVSSFTAEQKEWENDVVTDSTGLDRFLVDQERDRATYLKDEVFANDLTWILA